MLEKLKTRWEVDSNFQVLVIIFVFAITGSSTVFVRKPVFELLGVNSETSWFIVIPLYIMIIFPSYQIMLMIYGTLCGQFRFFWNFEKKMLKRFGIKNLK